MSESAEGVPPQGLGGGEDTASMEEWAGVGMSLATMEAVQMRAESQRRGMLVVKRNIAEAQARGDSYAAFKAYYRPVGIDGKLKDLWAEVAAQTRRDAATSALITRETGIADGDTLARAASARLAPQWDRSHRNGGPGECRWCGAPFGLTVWQYNCRACGWKVCAKCSPNAIELMQWLEESKPHELRRAPSNTPLRVCIGCWYAQASARGSGTEGDGSDHAIAVKGLLQLDHETLVTTLSGLPREDLLLLVYAAVEAASQRAMTGATEFLTEVSALLSDRDTQRDSESERASSVAFVDGPDCRQPESTLSRSEQLGTPSTAAATDRTSTSTPDDEELDVFPVALSGRHRPDAFSPSAGFETGVGNSLRRRKKHRRGKGHCCARPRQRHGERPRSANVTDKDPTHSGGQTDVFAGEEQQDSTVLGTQQPISIGGPSKHYM